MTKDRLCRESEKDRVRKFRRAVLPSGKRISRKVMMEEKRYRTVRISREKIRTDDKQIGKFVSRKSCDTDHIYTPVDRNGTPLKLSLDRRELDEIYRSMIHKKFCGVYFTHDELETTSEVCHFCRLVYIYEENAPKHLIVNCHCMHENQFCNMKEATTMQNTSGYGFNYVNNNGDAGTSNNPTDNNSRKYAILSTEWISAIGEELGMYPLPDALLRKLAEDASYRLREVLHKCMIRLKHSRSKCLTSNDVNAVITRLYDCDPVLGAPESMPEYNAEANVFVPNEQIVNLVQKINDSFSITQHNVPFIQESEVCDIKLTESRHSYAKRALKTLFNGSQKTFQVLLNDCATNTHLGGEGVIDKLMSIARLMVISNNAQYTRVSTRTCQLIIAIASNSEAVYPYHLNSVDSLTELLLELLLGQSFINTNLEALFKECALKLMLRWPSIADKYIPTLESVLMREKENIDTIRRKITAMELLASIQPLVFFQREPPSPLSLQNILTAAPAGSVLWHRIALTVCALLRSQAHSLSFSILSAHYGDSLLPYLPVDYRDITKKRKAAVLPIIVKSKIKYVNVRPMVPCRSLWDRQTAFPDSTLRGPRREIRFAFAGGRPVPPNNLKRVSLRANYQILRNDIQATLALVASRRLLVLKNKTKKSSTIYNLAHIHL